MDNTFYQNLLDERNILEQEIKAKEDKLRILNEFISAFFNGQQLSVVTSSSATVGGSKKIEPIVYSRDFTIPNRIIAALSYFKKANVTQVATKLTELDDDYTLDKAKADVKYHLSKLGRSGDVTIVQPGKGKRSGVYAYKQKEAA
jgi:hypothetical protein